MEHDADVIVIGSGIGGLVAAGLLARYGRQVLVCESHTIAGGAAHSFTRQGFHFDSGPSFFCGLGDSRSLNPLQQVLTLLGESLPTVAYDPLGHYHFPQQTLPIYGNLERYLAAIAAITPTGAEELKALAQRFLALYERLRPVPLLALRADWQLGPVLLSQCPWAVLRLLPQLPAIQSSVGDLMAGIVRDPFGQRLVDLECFLLSGLKAADTVAPEVAFMFGERDRSVVDYPLGGSGAVVAALVRGLERWGAQIRLGTPVEKIQVERGQVRGVQLRSGETLSAPVVISNATLWDTYQQLLAPTDLPSAYRQSALQTPAVDSFMHLHLGIRADGLAGLTVHHVVVLDEEQALTAPGNTCMISIPSVLDPQLAPDGAHVIHAYTLEPWQPWQRDRQYAAKKSERAEPLYRALAKVIPDIRDRVEVELIGTPLTHQRFLHRYRGTYGPAIAAGAGLFPSCQTPIKGLYRVGDSTLPGIGVPAVAASGILCANTLVSPQQTATLLRQSRCS
ncbi:phytoene desaturase family protein [Almyronema epifaneia]|uniref:Phytoene desaturase family protein n=1 Tax=Almyronema epifaneia S1 TaxID=2991925 RepID=A0ABW6IFX4_9CYAN